MNILVSGSIAYDRIMNFPGYFKDHLMEDKMHVLSVSFMLDKITESFGGTAGNIAYNLSLLGERPKVLGIVGTDFGKYEEWMREKNIDFTDIKKVKSALTASAYMIVDKDDNQISAFYPGHICSISSQAGGRFSREGELAIVAAEYPKRMMAYTRIYKENGVPYIFDPGQQIPALSAEELYEGICGAKMLIGNDYEMQMILDKIRGHLERNPMPSDKDPHSADLPAQAGADGRRAKENFSCSGLLRLLTDILEILVITKGAKGSEIYHNGKKIIIPSAKPRNVYDPTGAGDAYRAGFIKGLLEGWTFEKTGKFSSLIAVYAVENYGTQAHQFDWNELTVRFKENFGEEL